MSFTLPIYFFLHNLLERAARAIAAANTAIRSLILLALVICGDYTPLLSFPFSYSLKNYFQFSFTYFLTFYFLSFLYLPP